MHFIADSSDPIGRTLQVSDPIRPQRKSTNVFIIDRDAAVCDALSVTLRDRGFDTLAYSSAGEFLDRLPTKRQGCLLIELDLVDMTGVELVARLHKERMQLPAVIMSARLRTPILEVPHPVGVVAVLQKPFGQDELLKCLCRALRHPSVLRTPT